MDIKNNRVIIETERDAYAALSYINKSTKITTPGSTVMIGHTQKFVSPPNTFSVAPSVKPVKDNIASLKDIVEERAELPFELYPSTSRLVIDGMRKTALGNATTPDENVLKCVAANTLVAMNVSFDPSQPAVRGPEPALVSPHEL